MDTGKITLHGAVLSLTFDDSEANGNNSSPHHIVIEAGGRNFLVDGEEQEKIAFTVVGNWEISDLIDLFAKLAKILKEPCAR